jgi:hypothetical protein
MCRCSRPFPQKIPGDFSNLSANFDKRNLKTMFNQQDIQQCPSDTLFSFCVTGSFNLGEQQFSKNLCANSKFWEPERKQGV